MMKRLLDTLIVLLATLLFLSFLGFFIYLTIIAIKDSDYLGILFFGSTSFGYTIIGLSCLKYALFGD